MTEQITIREAGKEEMGWVNARYDEVGFQHSEFENDVILIAEIDGKKAGIGRLQHFDSDNSELGGMYVFPDFRKAGVARVIVDELLKRAKGYRYVFCLPFAHLTHFYRGFGFDPVGDGVDVPEQVAKKLEWCNCTYPDRTLMLVKEGAAE